MDRPLGVFMQKRGCRPKVTGLAGSVAVYTKSVLDGVAVLATRAALRIEVVDNLDSHRTTDGNQTLFDRRAQRALACPIGPAVGDDWLSAIRYGESQPIETANALGNDVAESRWKGRNITTSRLLKARSAECISEVDSTGDSDGENQGPNST